MHPLNHPHDTHIPDSPRGREHRQGEHDLAVTRRNAAFKGPPFPRDGGWQLCGSSAVLRASSPGRCRDMYVRRDGLISPGHLRARSLQMRDMSLRSGAPGFELPSSPWCPGNQEQLSPNQASHVGDGTLECRLLVAAVSTKDLNMTSTVEACTSQANTAAAGKSLTRVHCILDTEFCPGAYLSQPCRYAQAFDLPPEVGMNIGSTSSPHPAHKAMVL